jgi:hypothetical protein
MLHTQLAKENIDFIAEEVAAFGDLNTIKLGFDYRNKGYVYNVTVDYPIVQATVQNNKLYKVRLDLDFLLQSSCTCKSKDLCEHIVATFFYVYAMFDDPGAYMRDLNERLQLKAKQKSASASSKNKVVPKQTDSVAQWQEYFAKSYNEKVAHNQHNVFHYIRTRFHTFTENIKTWKKETKQLYMLYALLFLLLKIEEEKQRIVYSSFYHEYECSRAIDDMMGELFDILNEIDREKIRQEYISYVETLPSLLSTICFPEKESPIDWSLIYRAFWDLFLIPHPTWRQQEMRRLELMVKKKGLSPYQKDRYLLAQAHFHVITEQDQKAVAQWKKCSFPKLSDLFLYLRSFYHFGEWERLLNWLRWLSPYASQAHQEELDFICICWIETAKQVSIEEECLEVLRSLLPRSASNYTAYLLIAQRYQQWIDFHLAWKFSPMEIHPEELRLLEQEDLKLLLPLYHQSVERSILKKNRASYKDAVKLLKKLKAYYKRLKQPQRWEQYITRLAAQYTRLRAFQEELRKGKLIS